MNEPNITNQPKWSRLVLDFHMLKRFHMCHSVIFLYFFFLIFFRCLSSHFTLYAQVPRRNYYIIWSRRSHWILNKLLLFIKNVLNVPFIHSISFRFVSSLSRSLCYYYDYYYIHVQKLRATFVAISKSTKY